MNQTNDAGEVPVSTSAQEESTTMESSDESFEQTAEKTEFEIAMEISDEKERMKTLFVPR